MSKLKMSPPEEETERKNEAARDLATRIGRNVISVLGRPADFSRIVVVRLWDSTHRVNVLSGRDPTSTVIAHSYFVVVDDDGKVLQSTPPLAKMY